MDSILTALHAAGKGPGSMVWVNLCGLTPAIIQNRFEFMYAVVQEHLGDAHANGMVWAFVPTQRQIYLLYPQGTDAPSSEFAAMVSMACLRWTTNEHKVEIPELDFDAHYSFVQDEYDKRQRMRAQFRVVVNGQITHSEQRSGKGLFVLLVERLLGAGSMTHEQSVELRTLIDQPNGAMSVANLLCAFAVAAHVLNESGGLAVGSFTAVFNPLRDGDPGHPILAGHSEVPIDWDAVADMFHQWATDGESNTDDVGDAPSAIDSFGGTSDDN